MAFSPMAQILRRYLVHADVNIEMVHKEYSCEHYGEPSAQNLIGRLAFARTALKDALIALDEYHQSVQETHEPPLDLTHTPNEQ